MICILDITESLFTNIAVLHLVRNMMQHYIWIIRKLAVIISIYHITRHWVAHEKLKPVKTALINLYGHTHQKEHFYNEHPYMYCVCLDAHDMKPVLMEDIIEEIKKKRSAYRDDL